MSTSQERNQQDENTSVDKDTDLTRSQNRQAAANAAEHPAREFDPEGSGAGKQDRHREPGSSGSHREGNYNKNENDLDAAG